MSTEEKVKSVMGSMLGLDPAGIGPETSTDTVPGWDSIRHMHLIIALEEAFGITVPDEEVALLTSYPIVRATVDEQLGHG
jgi:acyl carrier protein